MRRRGDLFVAVAANAARVIGSTLRLLCIADRYQVSGIRHQVLNTLLKRAESRGILYWYALTVPPYS